MCVCVHEQVSSNVRMCARGRIYIQKVCVHMREFEVVGGVYECVFVCAGAGMGSVYQGHVYLQADSQTGVCKYIPSSLCGGIHTLCYPMPTLAFFPLQGPIAPERGLACSIYLRVVADPVP